MKILAIDTATEACSAALSIDNEVITRYQLAPREHSRLILKMIDRLMCEAELSLSALDALAFGQGPGAFMGIRIAAGVTQGIAYARDLPVIPVSNLMAIAEVTRKQTTAEHVLCAIDARMKEIYWAAYQYNNQGEWMEVIDECVCDPQTMIYPEHGRWTAAGTGWASYIDSMTDRLKNSNIEIETLLPACLPSAAAIARIACHNYQHGRMVNAEQAQPVYLRNNVASKPRQKTFMALLNGNTISSES